MECSSLKKGEVDELNWNRVEANSITENRTKKAIWTRTKCEEYNTDDLLKKYLKLYVKVSRV